MKSTIMCSWKHTFKAWKVCLIGALFFYFEFFQINMFNVLKPFLMQEFMVGSYELSLVASTYFYAIVLSLIPAGIILDVFSTRRIILYSLVVAITATIAFANANSVWQLGAARLLIGLGGGAFCLLSVVKLATRWFNCKQLSFVVGIIVSVGMLGGIVAQAPFAYLIHCVGWRHALLLDAAFGGGIFLLVWLFVEDSPEAVTMVTKAVKLEQCLHNLKLAAKNALNWVLGLFACLLNLPVLLLGSLMGNLYLTQAYGYSVIEASLITSMLHWGMLFGGPVWGMIAEKYVADRTVMLIGSLLAGCSLLALIFNNCEFTTLILIFFAIGFGSSAQVLVYSVVAKTNAQQQLATAEGITATILMSGGAVFQPILSGLLTHYWDGKLVNGVPVYTAEAFHYSFYLMPIAIGIGMLVVYFSGLKK
jgi:MFS family permease